ncbi:MAG: hypothetical protein ACRDS9_12925 [Pseudonocardiaceae bacterium]
MTTIPPLTAGRTESNGTTVLDGTITPPTGSDVTVPTARTSGPCPGTADAANLLVTGPVGAADPAFPPMIHSRS